MSCKTPYETAEVTSASAQRRLLPAGLALRQTPGQGASFPAHRDPGRGLSPCLQLQQRMSPFHQPLENPGPAPLCPLWPWAAPRALLQPCQPPLHPASQAASARPASSTCLCPLPFGGHSELCQHGCNSAVRDATVQTPRQGCMQLGRVPALRGMGSREQRSCLAESWGVAAAAPRGPRRHGAHLTIGTVTLRTLGCAGLSVTSPYH